MSDAPVIFKRKGRATQRVRAAADADSAAPSSAGTPDEDEGAAAESPSALASKLKKARAKPKPRATVSFGGDEEEGDGEAFKIKKSNLSKKLTLGKLAAANSLPSSLEQATITPRNDGPKYDAAYLSELKASTASARPRPPTTDSYDAEMAVDEPEVSETPNAIMDLTGDPDTLIPSQSSILAAKQKRERLRVAPPSEDFISLSLTKRDDAPSGPHSESRLMREDDEMGEGDDEYAEYTSAQERIALGKKSRKAEAKQKRQEMKEMIADAEEEDEETAEWENEQLRRGGHAVEMMADPSAKLVYRAAPIPPVTPIPTLGPAIARLTSSLSMLTTSHASSTATMAALAEERLQLEAREQEMRELIEKAEDKRSWFAAFRDWIENVATFLDEKFPQLEKLEDEHISLLKERQEMVFKRRREDDEDDLSTFLGSLPQPPAEPPQTDDLGRVIPSANPSVLRNSRRAARTARRAQRKRAASDAEEGYSTDGTLAPSDAADFAQALRTLAARAENITADVRAREFRDPRAGLARWFGEWRARHGDVYTGAWGGLGLVAAWEFWVRLELVGWNPLADRRTLDEFAWYVGLYEYSRPAAADGADGEQELGPDGDLASAMVATAAVPRVCKMLEGGALDPYSAGDVRRLVDLAEQLETSVERDHLKFQMFMKSAVSPFRSAVTDAEQLIAPYLAINTPRFDPEAIPARQRILARLSKLLDSMLRWRKHAGDLFGLGLLITRLVENSLVPVAETGWEVGGEAAARKAAKVLPAELMPATLKSRMA